MAAPLTAEDWEDFPGSPGDKKRPAAKGRIVGKIVEWKGRFGWIEPDLPVDHPEARMKGGRIFLSQEEVTEVISGVGAHVSFYVYADGTGLGAMLCVPSDSPAASAPFKKAKAKATPKPKAKAPTPGRKRVSEERLLGKIKSWRGGFGFITPTAPVEHPLFTGSIFLNKGDVVDSDELVEGKAVSFFLYADPQGLGAEECEGVGGSGNPLQRRDSSSALDGAESSSTLLKARPKGAAKGLTSDALTALTALTLMAPRAKGAPMKARPKASAAAAADPDLAAKMAASPELARQLSAWMFDPGG